MSDSFVYCHVSPISTWTGQNYEVFLKDQSLADWEKKGKYVGTLKSGNVL